MFNILPPTGNPYWHRNIGKALVFENREELLRITRPTLEDWKMLTIMKSAHTNREHYRNLKKEQV